MIAAVKDALPVLALLAATVGAGTEKRAPPCAPVAVKPCACAVLTCAAKMPARAFRLCKSRCTRLPGLKIAADRSVVRGDGKRHPALTDGYRRRHQSGPARQAQRLRTRLIEQNRAAAR